MEPQGGDQHPRAAVEGDVGCHPPLQSVGRDCRVVELPDFTDADGDGVVAGIIVVRDELDGDEPVFAGGYGLAGYFFSSDEADRGRRRLSFLAAQAMGNRQGRKPSHPLCRCCSRERWRR